MTAARDEGTTPDGKYWQSWSVNNPTAVVILVHGVHEHSGRYQHVADRLTSSGFAVYAMDLPGHGRSPGKRGNIGSMAATVDGVDRLTRRAAEKHPRVPLFLYGHSLGGLITLQYVTGAHHDRIRGAVVSAPALDISTATPSQKRVGQILSRWLPNVGVVSVDPSTLSRDPEVVRAYCADPLNHHGKINARTGSELVLTADGMPDRLRQLTMPLLVLHGSADTLMPMAASEVVRKYAASGDLTINIYQGLYHEIHNEPEASEVLADIVSWLQNHVEP